MLHTPLTIDSRSVKNSFQEKFDSIADSSDRDLHTAGYQYIPIDVHVPILDIPDLPIKPLPRQLATAVIQGTLVGDRRDYHRFFDDLIASLRGTLHSSQFGGIWPILYSSTQRTRQLGDIVHWKVAPHLSRTTRLASRPSACY